MSWQRRLRRADFPEKKDGLHSLNCDSSLWVIFYFMTRVCNSSRPPQVNVCNSKRAPWTLTDGADGSLLTEAERNEELALSNRPGSGALGRPWIVAGQPVARSSFQQRWLYLRANIDASGTAGMKPTSRGRIDRAGDFTGQNNSVCLLLRVWYRNR